MLQSIPYTGQSSRNSGIDGCTSGRRRCDESGQHGRCPAATAHTRSENGRMNARFGNGMVHSPGSGRYTRPASCTAIPAARCSPAAHPILACVVVAFAPQGQVSGRYSAGPARAIRCAAGRWSIGQRGQFGNQFAVNLAKLSVAHRDNGSHGNLQKMRNRAIGWLVSESAPRPATSHGETRKPVEKPGEALVEPIRPSGPQIAPQKARAGHAEAPAQ